MTIEEALKLLADKEPERFFYYEARPGYSSSFGVSRRDVQVTRGEASQDDIDTILAEIGFEFEIRFEGPHNGWSFNYWNVTVKDMWINGINSFAKQHIAVFPSKLDAAKAALIAVVETEYGGNK